MLFVATLMMSDTPDCRGYGSVAPIWIGHPDYDLISPVFLTEGDQSGVPGRNTGKLGCDRVGAEVSVRRSVSPHKGADSSKRAKLGRRPTHRQTIEWNVAGLPPSLASTRLAICFASSSSIPSSAKPACVFRSLRATSVSVMISGHISATNFTQHQFR